VRVISLISLLLFGLLALECFAQDQGFVDSLKKVIETAEHDLLTGQAGTTKAKALSDLAWELKYSNPDTSIILNNQALQVYKKRNDQKGIASCYSGLGVYYRLKSEYTKAIDYLEKSIKIQEQQGYKQGMAASYTNIGILYVGIV